MKKSRGPIQLLVIVLALMLCLGACASGTTGVENSSSTSNTAGSNEASSDNNGGKNNASNTTNSASDDVVEISFARSISLAADQEDKTDTNTFFPFIEEQMGIRIVNKWVTTPEQYNQKVALMLVSGDLADCFLVDMKTLGQMIDAGQATDMTDVWNEYASPLTKELMDAP